MLVAYITQANDYTSDWKSIRGDNLNLLLLN